MRNDVQLLFLLYFFYLNIRCLCHFPGEVNSKKPLKMKPTVLIFQGEQGRRVDGKDASCFEDSTRRGRIWKWEINGPDPKGLWDKRKTYVGACWGCRDGLRVAGERACVLGSSRNSLVIPARPRGLANKAKHQKEIRSTVPLADHSTLAPRAGSKTTLYFSHLATCSLHKVNLWWVSTLLSLSFWGRHEGKGSLSESL